MAIRVDTIDPSRTAVLVVDMQHDFLDPDAAMFARTAARAVEPVRQVLDVARETGMHVFFTVHSHRFDGSDHGLFGRIWSPIAQRASLVRDTRGTQVVPDLAPRDDEPVIAKHRYSAFFDTNLDSMLHEHAIETVAVCGTTTECCCHATARDAMFRDYEVVFLSDATGTFDQPDNGYGAMSAEEVQRSTLIVLANTTSHVMTADEFARTARESTVVPSGDRQDLAGADQADPLPRR